MQSSKNAKKQFKFQKELQDRSVKNSAAFAASSFGAIQDRSRQISDALILQETEQTRAARAASATEAVSAGESGALGTSANDVQQSFSLTLSEHLGVLDGQNEHERVQSQRQLDAVRNQQINSIYLADPVQKPSALGAATSIFAAYLSTKSIDPDFTIGGELDSFGGFFDNFFVNDTTL